MKCKVVGDDHLDFWLATTYFESLLKRFGNLQYLT